MKKRLISLVAAAALVGGVAVAGAPQVAKAGTVTVKGDTQATLYGFVWANYTWANQIAGSGNADEENMPLPDTPDVNVKAPKLYNSTYDETKASDSVITTRLGIAFKNEDANLTGRFEGDFWGGGHTSLRIRRAYVQHNFDGFYVLVGQEWILEEPFASISAGFTAPAGFDELILRVPQLRVGTNLDLGSANLDLALAFEWSNKKAVSTEDISNLDDGVNGYLPTVVDRYTFPTTAARAVLHFDTGFGAPAKFYAWGAIIPVEVSNAVKVFKDDPGNSTPTYALDSKTGKIVEKYKVGEGDWYADQSETSYAFGVGVKVPVSMFAIGSNFQYSDGATNYAGLSEYQPASYYVNSKGDDEDTEMYAWNVNLTVTPMPCVTVGGEYDYVEFKNDDVFNGDEPEVETYVGNVNIKTTKYTELTFEWRHIKAKDFDATGLTTDDDFSGDQYYVRYLYKF